MDNEKIGLFIASLRKDANLTQKELADKLFITDRAVSKWERGLSLPDISLLNDLSTILDVSVIEILKGERIKNTINNDEVIHSLEYAKLSFKEKVNNIFNIVSITIIVVIMSILLFNNIKIYLIQGSKYYPNVWYDNANVFSSVEESINLIKNNSGKYNEEEYKHILLFVEDITNITNIDSDKEMFNKEFYKYNDFKNVNENYLTIHSSLDIMGIKNIIKKYGDVVDIDSYFDSYYGSLRNIKLFISNSYKYNYVFDNEYSYGNDVKDLIHNKYSLYDILLKNIIEVGDIK